MAPKLKFMNQTFNFSRFLKYASYQFGMHKKIISLGVAGAFSVLILFLVLILSAQNTWMLDEWRNTFFILFSVSSCLIIGHAFPYYRQKEKAISTIMLPASVFEKFISEYVVRIVLYTLIFPILFTLAAKLSTPFATLINPQATITSFNLSSIFEIQTNAEFLLTLLPLLYFTSSAFLFAGSAAFNKYPLVKTMIFLAVVLTLGVGYFYILIEKLSLGNGIAYWVKSSLISSEENALNALYVILLVFISSTLTYAFFKLKEKEI